MSRLAVTGYASLDYVMRLDGVIVPDSTTLGRRDPAGWPRPGGCPTYIARAAHAAGMQATPVMWVGADNMGRDFYDTLADQGLPVEGIAMQGARSPSAIMAYENDGGCACLFDPGPSGHEALTEPQQAAIHAASHLCISVGPPGLMQKILDLRSPGVRLYWAAKNDPDSFSVDIAARLQTEADVIFCSGAERELVGDTNALVVQTNGAQGVTIEGSGGAVTLPVAAIAATDTTGAGDTFAGAFIAAEMAGPCQPETATRAGIAAAAALLNARLKETEA